MGKIKQLSDVEARKIAAGEVVERPVNVLKELLENSIDAGANQINIYLEDGGKKLIKVLDNGSGMDYDDAEACFKHHATSKLNKVSDLDNLNTFGFRGEALSSISAVSKVYLSTKVNNLETGIEIELLQGKINFRKNLSRTVGTEIAIKDLFYNLPARKKFLKKTETEYRQILILFQAFVINHKNVHFKLFSENKLQYNCPIGNLSERIIQLFDLDTSKKLINLENKYLDNSYIKVSGQISTHQLYKYNRSQIFFFVNNRWIKNSGLIRAMIKGYSNILPDGKYPMGAIFLEISSKEIDINVHPKKEEVLFLHPRRVEGMLNNIIKKTLDDNLSKHLSKNSNINDLNNFNYSNNSINKNFSFSPAKSIDLDLELINNSVDQERANNILKEENSNLSLSQNLTLNTVQDRNYRLVGQFNKTYILLDKPEGMMFVDQHAAHERILYEELINSNNNQVETVKLLFPIVIDFSLEELNFLLTNLNLLKSNGILAEQFGEKQIVINSVPVYLRNSDLKSLFLDFIKVISEFNYLDDKEAFNTSVSKKIKAQIACKAAVKAGDVLSSEKIHSLLDDLEKTEN